MRNLVPVHRSSVETGERAPYPLVAATVGADGNLLVAYQDDENVQIHIRGPTGWSEWPSWTGTHIVSILADDPAVVILRNGDFVECSAEGASIVGGFDAEILAAVWSPDQEMVCVATKEKVIFLSRSYDPVAEHEFGPSDLGLSKHVSVGWGKKETQFQGRGAHALRDPTMPETVDTGILCGNDDGLVGISWRGDGEFVAVSSIESSRRVIRVFSRSGVLSSVTEPTDYLAGVVAWSPSGSLIASIQQEPYGVVFFERNGLRRGGFPLSSPGACNLVWSGDSQVLAVQYKEFVELWTTKNYHWYRKQVIYSHTRLGDNIEWCFWHPEKTRTLILSWGTLLETSTFIDAVSRGPITGPEADGSVGVIDGDQLLVTPLGLVNIPPPMSFTSFSVEAPNFVAIDATNTRFAVAAKEEILVFKYSDGSFSKDRSVDVPGIPRQTAFTPEGDLVCLSDENTQSIITYETGESKKSDRDIYLLKPGYYQTTDGSVFELQSGYDKPIGTLSQVCTDFYVAGTTIFGLSRSGNLIVADPEPRVVAQGITSIALTNSYLLATTVSFLKFLHIHDPEIPPDNADSEQCREIERGSIIVTAAPSKMSVILQAPRGNLETIYPRMLVLAEVRRLILACKYKEAFLACRSHRIDLNLLYDYAPEQFKSRLPLILTELNNVGHVDLFISSLKNEDVSKTKYFETGKVAQLSSAAAASSTDKVNHVCDLLLNVLGNRLNKITALVTRVPPNLTSALQLCENLDEIQHLCFLTDVELLYKTALGMYDLKLALDVAQQAQKDPKEYLPFLRAREGEPQLRRQFVIDDYLKLHDKALHSLISCEGATENETLTYIERHALHEEALSVTSLDDTLKDSIMLSQAEQWMSDGRYAEAGLRFEYLKLNDRAVAAYTLAGAWKRGLSLGADAKVLVEQCIEQKKFSDAGELYAYFLNDIPSAIEFYCKGAKYDDAILVSRRDIAVYQSVLDSSLRESFGVIQELFSDCLAQVKSQLSRLREVREKKSEDTLGYADGRTGELTDDVSIAGTETTGASFMTRYTDKTGGTAQTGASRRTAKNRRREERKKARGKKGTIYEEEYLISSTGRLIERLAQTRPEAQALVEALLRCQMEVYSAQITSAFASLVRILEDNVDEICNIQEADLCRYDEEGNMYMLERPSVPPIPKPLS